MTMSCPKQSYRKIVGGKSSHQNHSTLLHPKNEKLVKTERASISQTQSNNTDNKNQNDKARGCFTEVELQVKECVVRLGLEHPLQDLP